MSKILLTLTNARSGTVFLYHTFRKAYGNHVTCHHESISLREAKFRRFFHCTERTRQIAAMDDPVIFNYVSHIKNSLKNGPVLIFGNTQSHLAPILANEFGDDLQFLFLHRDILVTSASVYTKTKPDWWINIPQYELDYYGNKLVPSDPHVRLPRFKSAWSGMNLFEKIVYNTIERTKSHLEITEVYNQVPTIWLSSREMFSSRQALRKIADFMELTAVDFERIEVPKNTTWRRSVETHPIDLNWLNEPIAWPELADVSAHLGHSLDREEVEHELKKYVLPGNLGSRLRHRCRFWPRRASVAGHLRRVGLLPERPTALGEEP